MMLLSFPNVDFGKVYYIRTDEKVVAVKIHGFRQSIGWVEFDVEYADEPNVIKKVPHRLTLYKSIDDCIKKVNEIPRLTFAEDVLRSLGEEVSRGSVVRYKWNGFEAKKVHFSYPSFEYERTKSGAWKIKSHSELFPKLWRTAEECKAANVIQVVDF